MQRILLELRGATAFVRRNFHLTKRYWKWELVWFVYTMANAVTMGFIGRGFQMFGATVNTEYIVTYMLIGSILWGYLSLLFEITAETVAWERWEETIEYTFMAPISRITHLVSMSVYSIIYGIIRSGVILLVASLFFNLELSKANFLSAGIILAVSSLSFVGLGMIGAVLPLISPEKGTQVVHIFQAVLLMFSGVYYEVEVLPKWMQMVARFSPATYALKGIRGAILEGLEVKSLWPICYPLLLMGGFFIPLGLWTFRRTEIYAKKKGLLKRNG